MTDLLGHDRKVTSDEKMTFISDQRNKGGKRDYFNHFPVIFETTSKFPIVFLRLAFRKLRVDGVTGQRWEIDLRYESDLKVILKGLG